MSSASDSQNADNNPDHIPFSVSSSSASPSSSGSSSSSSLRSPPIGDLVQSRGRSRVLAEESEEVASTSSSSLGVPPDPIRDAISCISSKQVDEALASTACSEVAYTVPLREDRCHAPPEGSVAFYLPVIDKGVGFPVHPFFCNVLRSYNLSPFNISPVSWCHLVGTFFIFHDCHLGLPSLREWHHLYRLNKYRDGYYYLTKWPGSRSPLVTSPPTNSSGWPHRYFYLQTHPERPEFIPCGGVPPS